MDRKNRRMVGGIKKWLAGWIDIIYGSLDGQEKIERWLDGYKNGRMDRKKQMHGSMDTSF